MSVWISRYISSLSSLCLFLHLLVPVTLLHLSPLSPWSVFPPTPLFSIEVSLAVVDLNTWSGLFSHSVPSSHSAPIVLSLFSSHSSSLTRPYSQCLFTHLFPPLGWPAVHFFRNNFSFISLLLSVSSSFLSFLLSFPFCALPSFLASFLQPPSLSSHPRSYPPLGLVL